MMQQQQVTEKSLDKATSINPLNPSQIPVAKSKQRSSSTLALNSTKRNSREKLEQSLKLLVKQQVLNVSQVRKPQVIPIQKDGGEKGGAVSSSQERANKKFNEGSVIKLQRTRDIEKPKSRAVQEIKSPNKSQEFRASSINGQKNVMTGKRITDGNKSGLFSARYHTNKEIVKIPPALATEPDAQVSERKLITVRILSESLSKSPSIGFKNSLATSPYLSNVITIKSGKFQQNRANPIALPLYNSGREEVKLPQIEETSKSPGINQAEPLSAERQKHMIRIYQNKQSNRIKTLETRVETSEDRLDNSVENRKKQSRPKSGVSPQDRRKNPKKVAKTTQNRSQSMAVVPQEDPVSILDELRKETEASLPDAQSSAQPIDLFRKKHKLSNHHVKVLQTQKKLKNSKEDSKKKYTRLLKSSIQPILDRLHKRVDSYLEKKNLNNQYLILSERNEDDMWR